MWLFNPIYKEKIWGGNSILKYKGLEQNEAPIGESWELSGEPGNESVVTNGKDKGLNLTELIDKYGATLLGQQNFQQYGGRFPLLVKFLDATQPLSVQVHPNDEMANRKGFPFGKTEMWYVVGAQPDSEISVGFNRPLSAEEYTKIANSDEIENCLAKHKIRKGDTFFIPAGRVHALGSGAFIMEVQQSSDLTYRIYDYGRRDSEGNLRELHTDLALEAINFDDRENPKVNYTPKTNIPVNLIDSTFFTVNALNLDQEIIRDYSERDSFVILVVTEGVVIFTTNEDSLTVKAGTTVLLPASTNQLTIKPLQQSTVVETYI